MGRHGKDQEESLTEKITGPFRRVRPEEDTQPNQFETKRRSWPVALIVSGALAAAVGIPVGLMSADPDTPPDQRPSAVSGSLSASPVPTVTVTETQRIKTGKPVPVPTKTIYRPTPVPGPTIYRTDQPAPAPTVTETIKQAVPGPTKTKRVEVPGPTVTETVRIRVRVCFGAWANGNYERIPCP